MLTPSHAISTHWSWGLRYPRVVAGFGDNGGARLPRTIDPGEAGGDHCSATVINAGGGEAGYFESQ